MDTPSQQSASVSLKRLWGIRHVRYFLLCRELEKWWWESGRFLGACPNEADLNYLDQVWRGEA
jgi:hypothetical protein